MATKAGHALDARGALPHTYAMLSLSSPLRIAALIMSASLAIACGDDDDSNTGGSGPTGGAAPGGAGTGATGTGGATGGGGGNGGDGGDGGGFVVGDPIDAPADQWTWVDFPESRCINDTPTGIAINPHPTSDDVIIFLMGGNACFNVSSCSITANTNGYGADKFANETAIDAEVFDRSNPENPFRDYSYVWVPYCSGDVFAGDNEGVTIGQTRTFKGFRNIGEFLKRVVPTFPDANKVVLTGVSAGGFGAMYNYDQVASAFAPVDVFLLDDSGPPMGAGYLAPCLLDHFVTTWGADKTLPSGCTDCLTSPNGFIEPYINYVQTSYPDARFALISSVADATIRTFWGYGLNDCANLNDFLPPAYSAAEFEAGLYDLRDNIASPNFRTYYPEGDRHVWLDDPPWMTVENGKNLAEWIQEGLSKDPNWTDHAPDL